MNDWRTRSEIVAGLVLEGKLKADAVNLAYIHPPYDDLIELYQDGNSREAIWDKVGHYSCDAAINAAKAVDGNGFNYLELCEWASIRTTVGEELAPFVSKWKDGRDADVTQAQAILSKLERPVSSIVCLEDVIPMKAVWHRTFYNPVDNYFGGFPAGLIVIGAPPGVGKTSLVARLMLCAAREGKETLLFSLEMNLAQIKYRMKQLATGTVTGKLWRHMHACELVFDIDSIYAEAIKAAHEMDLYMIAIDFADMIIPLRSRRNRVDIIDEIYRQTAALSLKLGIPVVVISQLNDRYVGGRPRVNHLRGSRLIEALASMVILLYNPDQLDVAQDDKALPKAPGCGYFILGKSRYGWEGPGNYSHSIGAVQVPWEGAKGWADHGRTWIRLSSA